jgi:hypothetical protein
MHRGIVSISPDEAAALRTLAPIIESISSETALAISKLDGAAAADQTWEVDRDTIETILDQLPPPTMADAAQNSLRTKLLTFVQGHN